MAKKWKVNADLNNTKESLAVPMCDDRPVVSTYLKIRMVNYDSVVIFPDVVVEGQNITKISQTIKKSEEEGEDELHTT